MCTVAETVTRLPAAVNNYYLAGSERATQQIKAISTAPTCVPQIGIRQCSDAIGEHNSFTGTICDVFVRIYTYIHRADI